MLKCKNVFWVDNITDLFCDFRIIPFKKMDLESQMNALTRFVFLIFILFLIFTSFKNSLIFLTLSLVIIILFYYIKKKHMKDNYKEMFTMNTKNSNKNIKRDVISYKRGNIEYNPKTGKEQITINRPSDFIWCNDEVPFAYNSEFGVPKNYVSMNQQLAGKANLKTHIPPVIVPPIAALDYWKTNNLITHSRVNDQKQTDIYQSGYQVSTPCGADDNNMYYQDNTIPLIGYNRKKTLDTGDGYKKNKYQKNTSNLEEYTEIKETFEREKDRIREESNNSTLELPYEKLELPYEIKPEESGEVNLACGYDPEQLFEANLPSNYPAGDCEKTPAMKEYNKNLFTQIIQPGVYTTNQVNEPVNSNIGISFTQQFEPVSTKVDENGLTYTLRDPRLYEKPIEPYIESVNCANVYDPRLTGYGTSYRAYTDDKLGQTKFYYDDIDSIRMPNYITRSNIDFMKAADTYGPMVDKNGNQLTSVMRNLANNEFAKSSIQNRTDIQQSLMRKNNASAWQQKVAPLNRNVPKFSSR
jgi:Ca2+/Na+ antiporter